MNIKNNTKSTTKNNPPFYFKEGKGWYIDTKVRVGDEYKHLRKGYFPTMALARMEFPVIVAEMQSRETSVKHRNELPWEGFCEAYLDFRRTKLKGASLAQEKVRLNALTNVLGAHTKVGKCFNRSAAASVQRYVMGLAINRTGKNKIISVYQRMAEFAYERDYMENDHDLRVVKSETSLIAVCEEEGGRKQEKHVISCEEETALLGAIDNPVDKMLVLTLIETGMRFGEVIALSPSDIDPLACEVSVTKTVSVDENGSRKVYNRTKTALGKRSIPVSTAFINTLSAYVETLGIKQDGLLFPGFVYRDSKVMDGTAFRKRLNKYCERAGIDRVTPHCFRHTYATRLSQKCYTDADRQARAYLLGHSVAVDEQVYTAHNQLETAKNLLGGVK